MVEVRVERREVCFRIVFLGRSGATKFANVRRLHEALADRGPGELTVMHAGGDRVVGFRLFDESEEPVDELRVGFQCVTIPGEPRSPATERLLAASADAIVWLDDREGEDASAPSHLGATLEALDGDFMVEDEDPWPRPVLVQCYADDDEERAGLYRKALGDREGRIRRVDSDDAGLISVFDDARERVIEAFRREASRERGRSRKGRRESPRRNAGMQARRRARSSVTSTRALLKRLIGIRADAAAGRAALRRAEFALLGALFSLGLAGLALLVSLTL